MLYVLFTSTRSNNCRDFVSKLNYPYVQELTDPKNYPDEPFLLITGTYADAKGRSSLHENVQGLLRDPYALNLLKGVAASGNRVFGDMFGLSGEIISQTLDIPLVDKFELKGLPHNVETVRSWIDAFNKENPS